MPDETRYRPRRRSTLDGLFAGGSIAAFTVLMSSVGEALYLYLR